MILHRDDQIVVAQCYTEEHHKNLYLYMRTMKKFKLVKEKWYFQSLRETKSVRELDDWAVEISWYASTKDKDRWWDVVEPKAFASALERYMTNPIVLLQHKADKPIWIVEQADIDDNWLWIKAKISQNTDWVIDLIKDWVLRAFSIWYSIKDYETDVRELADWTYDMTNIIKDLELYEISVVSIPMNPYALSKSVADMLEVEESEEENSDPVEETVEEAETIEEKVEENDEEKSIDDWSEMDQNDEEAVEWDNVQDEEENEPENIEEHPNEEVETKEMNEEENENVEHSNVVDLWAEENEAEMHVESENNEEKTDSDDESVNNEADEQSEIIDEESVEKDSENAVETQANDEEVVETHNDEVVETKSIEPESQKQFDFESKIAQLSKSFDEKLASKDEQIKSLESKVETMTKLFADSLETIDRMTVAVKNTPVNSGLQYKRPLKKWWYYDIAEIIKSL